MAAIPAAAAGSVTEWLLPLLASNVKGADKINLLVRTSRVLYGISAGSIVIIWYSGWRNERTEAGDTSNIPIPGLSKLKGKGWQFASRGDAPPPTVAPGGNAAPTPGATVGGGVLGSAVEGATHPPLLKINMPGAELAWTAPDSAKKHASYNGSDYNARLATVGTIDALFHLRFSSGYRSAAQDRSQGRNYHSFHEDGLAFDQVGRDVDMRKAANWAAGRPDLFQEVFVHDEGSGMHLHLAFWPNAGKNLSPSDITGNSGATGGAASNGGPTKGPIVKRRIFAHPNRPNNRRK